MTIRGARAPSYKYAALASGMEGGAPAMLMTTAGSQELTPPSIYEIAG